MPITFHFNGAGGLRRTLTGTGTGPWPVGGYSLFHSDDAIAARAGANAGYQPSAFLPPVPWHPPVWHDLEGGQRVTVAGSDGPGSPAGEPGQLRAELDQLRAQSAAR